VTARVLQFAPRRKAEQSQPAIWYLQPGETPDAFLARVQADCEASGIQMVLNADAVAYVKETLK
jgi:hypothetical protein